MSAKPITRILQLDVLRGLAIGLVLFRHGFPLDSSNLAPIGSVLYKIGWTGVDLFFVLSGFLVGGLLFSELRRNGTLDIQKFVLRRGFKIWPSYYLLLLVIFIQDIRYSAGDVSAVLPRFIPNLCHLQNYFRNGLIGHTWSLSVEEHFYLVLPLLLAWLAKRSTSSREGIEHLTLVAGLVIVGCLVFRTCSMASTHDWVQATAPTHGRIDSLFFGVLIAYAYHYRPQFWQQLKKRTGLLACIGVILMLPAFFVDINQGWYMPTIGLTILGLAYSCILVSALCASPESLFFKNYFSKAMAFLGTYSYSIYLWHPLFPRHFSERYLINLAMYPDWAQWLLITGFYITISVLTGIFFAKLVEIPMLKLRDRLLAH